MRKLKFIKFFVKPLTQRLNCGSFKASRNQNDRRFGNRPTILSHLRLSAFICGSLSLGCADKTADPKPLTTKERHEALLRDPFSDKTDEKVDISGGKINELDRKAIKKDLDHVFNP